MLKKAFQGGAAVFCLLAILTVGLSATYAYLTSKDTATNQITVAEVDTPVEEEFVPPTPAPGAVAKKIPKIKNNSTVPVYVRAKAVWSNSDAADLCEPLVISSGWTLSNDGWYYYGSPVKPGEATGDMFKQVKFKDDITQQDITDAGKLDLIVYAESTQAQGHANAAQAWAEM